MSQEQYLKSPCNHCHGRISFPATARGMSIACPHCGQQTVLNAAADDSAAAPAEAAPAAPAEPAPAQPTAAKLVAKPVAKPVARTTGTSQATPAKPVAGKPLSDVQKAALEAARAASPGVRSPGPRPAAKGADKKSMVVKAQWADGDDGEPGTKPLRCDFCGTKIPTGAAACPDCGTVAPNLVPPPKPSWFRRVGLVLVLLLAVVAAVRWGQYYLSIRPKKDKDGKLAKEGVELLTHSWQKQPGTALLYVRGSVTNHSDVAWYGVKVECDLIDKTGASLGKFSDSKMVLDPHKLFPFSISVLDPDAVRYTNITVSAQR